VVAMDLQQRKHISIKQGLFFFLKKKGFSSDRVQILNVTLSKFKQQFNTRTTRHNLDLHF
jgi:hypothetical protein